MGYGDINKNRKKIIMNHLNRNSSCSCGSKKKYKNCCGKDNIHNSWYSKFTNILLPLLIVVGVGIVTSKIVMSDKELEQVWCENCQTYHSKAVANDEQNQSQQES